MKREEETKMDNNQLNQFVGSPIPSQIGINPTYGNAGVVGCGCNGIGTTNTLCGCQRGQNVSTQVLEINDGNTVVQDLQQILRNYLGKQVTCEFCACGNTMRKSGVLSCVGSNFITLNGNNGTCLVCDTSRLSFVTVCNER